MTSTADDIGIQRLPRRAWRYGRFNRTRVLQVLAGLFVVLLLIAFVPPLRRAAALVVSKVILTVASPWAPSVGNFDDLAQSSRILAADGTELTRLDGAQRREPVKLADLPPHVSKAVLAAEDATFYSHDGVEPTAIVRAVVRTAQGNKQGGSTITQQLAKINYTNSERTFLRKLRELQYATQLEKKFTKDELLERYLNQVYFGDGAYGIDAAAQVFFGVGAAQLTPAQAATLAGKIKSPEGLDPRTDPAPVQARRDQVLRNMSRHGWLGKPDLDASLATPMELVAQAPTDSSQAVAPHFIEYVKREAAKIDALGGSPESRGHQLFTGGYTIETTLDPKLYDQAVSTVRGTMGGPADPATAIVSVQPGDGAIRMLFGGLTFDRKFDVASQGRRQPGSSFKPYVYLAAIRDGISPRSVLPANSPMTLNYRGGNFTVNNYEGEGGGESDLENAMAQSINVVFSQLALEVGLDNVVSTAEAAGIPKDIVKADRRNPAVALGGMTKGVTPLEQAAAYATFAAKGVYAEPYAITAIKDRDGNVVYSHQPETKQVFGAKEVGVLNTALLGVVERGTARAAQIGRPMAGKTGTTQNYGDAWFVGFVPQLSTAVWVGYPDKVTPMTNVHGRRVSGGSFPAQMFSTYMMQAVAEIPIQQIDTAAPEELALRMLNEPPPTIPPPPTTDTTLPTTTSSSTSTTLATTTTTVKRSTTTTTSKKGTTTTTSSTTSTTQPASDEEAGSGSTTETTVTSGRSKPRG